MADAYIVGAGPQGRIVQDILRMGGTESIEFVDEDRALWGRAIAGATVIGGLGRLMETGASGAGVIVALGNPITRMRLIRQLQQAGIKVMNAIHPRAIVMPSVELGAGVVIHPGAVVNTGARLGDGVIVNTGAIVEHDSVLEAGVCISPGAQTGGRVEAGTNAFLGSGCIILKRRKIGAGAVVAAGSLVTRDVLAGTLVMGSPARQRETIGPDFDWGRLL